MILLMKLAAVGSILLALMSVYPGMLNDFALIALLLFLVVMDGWIILLMKAGAAETEVKPAILVDDVIRSGKSPVHRRRWFIVSIAILILDLTLVVTGIPRRVAFVVSRPAFQLHAATAPASDYSGEALGRLLGVYYVDRYAADPRGGVYFRTHRGADGIGPDTMTYGFAFRPNSEGSPYGRAGYHYSRVVGDWYVFSASNDF